VSLRRLLPGLVVLVSLLAIGCGGGDGDEEEITDAIQVSATTNDPSNCTELQTQAFVEQTEFAEGEEAIESCQEEEETATADSVAVENIEVDGDAATAEATFEGSTFDGQKLVINLVKEDDAWKLDEIAEFKGFDKQAFLDAFGQSLTAPPNPLQEQQAQCIVRFLGQSDDQKLQEVLLGGDPQPLQSLFGICT
jgi:hypothetical protein